MSTSKCATCNIQFENLSDMRDHFQGDWHCHNVKLRVDGKKPVSRAAFKDAANGEDVGDDKPQFACTLCKKYFRSVQTLQSHVKSTDHLLKKEKRIIDRDSDAASMLTATSLGSAALGLHRRAKRNNNKKATYVDPLKPTHAPKVDVSIREEDVTETSCLFCGHPSKSMKANLVHLKTVHTFTIPMEERCTDVAGLMNYLARKVNGCMCLICGVDSKSYSTLEAVRGHMKAKNHEYIELGVEYNEFYGDTLDDLDADVEKPKEEEGVSGNMELVVTEGGKRVAKRRDIGVQRFRAEGDRKMEERRLITAAKVESAALVLKERNLAEAPARKEERKNQHRHTQKQNKWMMQMGVRSNMFHRKGYDGEGETN